MLAGMLAGADSIDDLDVLRAGSTSRVIGPVRAPSTMGTFLRSFTHGHVLQLAAINRRLLAGLQASIPTFIDPSEPVLVDMDDTIGAVHGYQKQAAAFGYSKVRGLNALAITVSTDHSSPVISEFSLRRGNIRSGDHADWHLARTLAAVDTTAQGREGLVRADSAFCTHGNVSQAQRAGASFSFTLPHWPTVHRALSPITDTAAPSLSPPWSLPPRAARASPSPIQRSAPTATSPRHSEPARRSRSRSRTGRPSPARSARSPTQRGHRSTRTRSRTPTRAS